MLWWPLFFNSSILTTKKHIMHNAHRGAEAWGILGVNTPTFWAYTPHFLEGLKNGS